MCVCVCVNAPLSLTPRSAGKQEIIKAYRKLAQQWHPDNFQSETDKKEAEKRFIDIASAKEVLIDPGGVRVDVLPCVLLVTSLDVFL